MLKRLTKHNRMFLIIAAAAVFARAFRFGAVPGGINQDEAMAAYDAYSLSLYGTDRYGMFMPVHFTAWGFGQMSVLMSYLMTPFIKIFGLSVWVARLPMLIVSLLGLYAVYLLSKELLGNAAALAIFGFCAVNPWHVMQSRWALDCNMFPHFFLFGVYFLCKGIKGDIYADGLPKDNPGGKPNAVHGGKSGINLRNRRRLCLIASMLCFGLSMYAYGIAIYTVPLFLLAASVFLTARRFVDWRGAALCVCVYLLTAWPVFGVMIINSLGLPSLRTPFFTIPYFPDSVRAGDLLFFANDRASQLARNIQSLFRVTVLQKDGLPWNVISDFGCYYMISIPFTVIGIYGFIGLIKNQKKSRRNAAKQGAAVRSAAGQKRAARGAPSRSMDTQMAAFTGATNGATTGAPQRAGIALLFIWLAVAVFSGLIVSDVNVNRINIIFYPVIILTGYGLTHAAVLLRRVNMRAAKVVGAALAVTFVILFAAFEISYFTDHNDYLSYLFYGGWNESVVYALDSAGVSAGGKPAGEPARAVYITAYSQYDGAYQVSEILTLFAGQIDPHYYGSPDYRDKYRYVKFSDSGDGIKPAEMAGQDAVFVFNAVYERQLFPDELFDVGIFGWYGVATTRVF